MYILDDHDQKGQLNSQSFLIVNWTRNEGSGDIGPHDF